MVEVRKVGLSGNRDQTRYARAGARQLIAFQLGDLTSLTRINRFPHA